MTTILCYGDSNTWGADPAGGPRFDAQTRWGGVLREALGAGYTVIEEGMSGRTTVYEDPVETYTDGRAYLIPCLKSHKPLDWVIILLGTNDLHARYSLTAYDIGRGAAALVQTVQRSDSGPDGAAPQVLLICPPPLATLTRWAEPFTGGAEKSRQLAGHYARVAQEQACHFLDAGRVIESSPLDGIHWEAEAHRKLGQAVAAFFHEQAS